MSRRTFPLMLVFAIAVAIALQAESSDFLPAGTLLSCTMDEPNFSAKTAEVGDPLLCYLEIASLSGHTVLPRGASLGGRLTDAHKPGHFVGKGSLSFEFDRLVLPGEGIFPLASKVVAVPHYKVARNGKISGKGHAKRDAVEWAIPALWPVKVLTLPARGPYPALKGEARLTLRLLEDVSIPSPQRGSDSARKSSTQPSNYTAGGSAGDDFRVINAAAKVQLPQDRYGLTLILLKDHNAYLVESYRLSGETLRCVFEDGSVRAFGLSELDFPATVEINRQRGIGIVLETASAPQIETQ